MLIVASQSCVFVVKWRDVVARSVVCAGLKEGKWEMNSSGEGPSWRSHAEAAQQLPAAGDADMTTSPAVLSARQAPMAGPD